MLSRSSLHFVRYIPQHVIIRLGVPNTYHLVDMVRKEPVMCSFYEAELQRVFLPENKASITENIIRHQRAPHLLFFVK